MSADTSRAALNWFTKEYDRTAPERQRAADEAIAVSQAQRGLMTTQTDIAKDYDQYNRTTFRPLEQRMVSEAQAYDTPARRNAAAAEAVTDVETAAGRARTARMANLASYGIAPDSMKSQTLDASADVNTARTAAGAAGGARDRIEATGYARMADAANMGRGLPSAQATAVQTANNAGNSAVGSSNAGLAATMSGTPLMQAGFGAGMQGAQVSGNLFAQKAQLESGDGGLGALMGGVGGLFRGIGAMQISSKDAKTDKRALDPEEALAAVNETPVEGCSYKPGMADGGTHIGPYAEDVQRTQGNGAAPGGKVVSFVRMAKNNTSAIQALTERLTDLEEQLAQLKAA